MAFLDYDGLSRFWGKVKDYIASNSGGRGNAKIFVGTCSTIGSTAIKDVTCPDYDQLVVGDVIYVTFTYANEVPPSTLKLNVNNTGAKNIKRYNGTSNSDLSNYREISTGSPIKFIYDGTYWKVDSAGRIKITNTVGDNNSSYKSLLATATTDTGMEASVEKLSYAYYYRGRLYSGGNKVLTDSDYDFANFIPRMDAVDVRHDQYLYDLESNEYRVVLRMFFVTPDGHILKKDQSDVDSDFLGNKSYRVSVKAYDSSNNVVTTYHDVLQLHWCPSDDGVYQEWSDESDIFSAPYWLEVTTRFVLSSGIDHIAVSFTNLDQDLYMYNPNQDLTFNITSLSHNLVEIKNVGLVYANGLDAYNGGYLGTGYNLPDETVYVPQIWASDLESAELIRGYSYAIKGYDADNDEAMYWASANSYDYKISDKLVVHDGKFFYTTGYFEIPITEDSGAIQSNQGVANAGKFLVVNSSGVVEPVSMTAWQGGSY